MIRVIIFLALSILCNQANAIIKCEKLYQVVTTESSGKYKALVRQYFLNDNRVSKIYVQNVMKYGDWFIINASTDVTDPAFFFFKNNTYIDIWDGVIFPEEKNKTLKWTQQKKMPQNLAECFIDSITIK